MNKTRNFFIFLGIAVLVVVVCLGASLLFKKPQKFIDFTVTLEDNTEFTLSDSVNTAPTVLVFADPDDEYTKSVFEALGDTGDVRLVALTTSELEKADQLDKFSLVAQNADVLVLNSRPALDAYNVSAAPITYFIDKDGYVQDVFIGKFKPETAKKSLKKIGG